VLRERNKINLQELFLRKNNQFIITSCLTIVLSNALNLIVMLLLTIVKTINLKNFFLTFDNAQQESNYIIYQI